MEIKTRRRFPSWLKRELPSHSTLKTHEILERHQLTTICESAKCPNRSECYSKNTATFLILGEVCTRSCSFCSVPPGKPGELDLTEPDRVADAAVELGLSHVVVTSVNRDDLESGGAEIFVDTIHKLRERIPNCTIEVLTPDFCGNWDAVRSIVDAKPDVFNHNMETVKPLYSKVRPRAIYERSLELLSVIKKQDPSVLTKSGFMLGCGETKELVDVLLEDLKAVDCDIVTVGQYLQPAGHKMTVEEFIHPSVFERIEKQAQKMGFKEAYCAPFVRSSYHAGEVMETANQ